MEKRISWSLARKQAGWIALILLGLTIFIAAGVYFDWGKSDWAAWVQAVGSIAAILAAARIAAWQATSASREYDKRRAEADKAKALAIKYILQRTVLVVENAARVIAPEPASLQRPVAYGGTDAPNVDIAEAQIEMVQSALRSLPMFEIPSPDLIFVIQRADRDLLYVQKLLRSRKLLNDPTRRSRTGPTSVFVRIRRRLSEATKICEAVAKGSRPSEREEVDEP